jgi:hypothetical protein
VSVCGDDGAEQLRRMPEGQVWEKMTKKTSTEWGEELDSGDGSTPLAQGLHKDCRAWLVARKNTSRLNCS